MKEDKKGAVVPLNISTNMEVSKEDLIAIKVASHEKDLTQKETAMRKEIDSIRTQIMQTNKELTAEGKKLTLALCEGEPVKAVIAGLVSLGVKEACATVGDIKGLHKQPDGSYQTEIDVTLSISDCKDSQGYSTIKSRHTIDASGEFLTLLNKLDALKEEKTKATSYALEIKKALVNIPKLERQARAKFAEHALSSTEEGRAVLDNINGLDASFLLPEKTS